MSQTPGIGSSREDHPPAESSFQSGSPSAVYSAVIQETVLNPEGRRSSNEGSTSSTPSINWSSEPARLQNSQLWRRLFPVEADPAGVVDFDSPSGCELGHFSIEERIGSGGMGAVFRALDNRLQRVVAVKVLAPGQSRDPSAVSRFQNEARAAARLDHENIARVYYVGEDHGLHFIAFEYVTGQNVRDLIARLGRLSVGDSVNYVLQIASALRHTASAGVVHRDIKPSNIIIAPNGRAKLVDLGLARKIAADSYGDLTVAGTTLGTFDYISPEQARDPRNVDVRSDIYSLGCTLYHMLTGGPPYSSGTVLQKLLDHQSGQAPDPRTANPAVPPALSAVCRKMMAGDPKNRYSTPDELIRDLVVIAGSLGLRPLPADGYVWTRTPVSSAPRIRPGLIWAGSAALVVILAFFVDVDPSSNNSADQEPRTLAQKSSLIAKRDETASPEILETSDQDSVDSSRVFEPAPLGNYEPRETSATDSGNLAGGDSVVDVIPGSTQQSTTERRPFPQPLVAESGPAASGPSIMNDAAGAGDAAPLPREPKTEVDVVVDQNISNESLPFLSLSNLLELVGQLPKAAPSDVPQTRPSSSTESGLASSSAVSPTVRETDSSAETLARPYRVRSSSGSSDESFDSLAEAVANARSYDTVELHYNGLPTDPEESQIFSVNEKAITIRAGRDPDGFEYRPIIPITADPEAVPDSRLISVTGEGGTLTLRNVELQVKVIGEATNSARQWAVFSLSDTQHIHLDNVGITIIEQDPSWSLATFDLRLSDELSANPGIVRMMSDASVGGFYVEINNSLIRGAGDLFSIAHTLPGTIRVQNSAFAIKRAMFNATGGIKDPPAGEQINVEIDHVTAVLGDALLWVDVGQIPRYVMPMQITAKSNVLATSTAGPLVFMKGNASSENFSETLAWDGERNIFDGFPEFWSAYSNDRDAETFPANFKEWRTHWETIGEHEIPLGEDFRLWANKDVKYEKRPEEFVAEDFALNRYSRDIVFESADTGELVGADPGDLPRLSGVGPRTAQGTDSLSR